MPELIAKAPLSGRGPHVAGGVTLALSDPGSITSIALYPGQDKAANKALKPLGLAVPAPGTQSAKGAARLLWAGRDMAFLLGVPAPDMGAAAALTDQSDGWATFRLTGQGAADVLMRLVPLDLRPQSFAPGRVARAPLNHMQMVLAAEEDGFTLLVFRSMAETAWHDITQAMATVAARRALA